MSERPSFPRVEDRETVAEGFERGFDVFVGGEAINFCYRFLIKKDENGPVMEGQYIGWKGLGSMMDDDKIWIMAADRGMDALEMALAYSREFYPDQEVLVKPQVLNVAGLYTAWDLEKDPELISHP